MTYKEETYVLDTLKELKELIRSPNFRQLVRETHENNVMLRQIIRVINTYLSRHHQENEDDFNRNVLANLLSEALELRNSFKEVSFIKN